MSFSLRSLKPCLRAAAASPSCETLSHAFDRTAIVDKDCCAIAAATFASWAWGHTASSHDFPASP
eukprot:6435867-Pyramimonas_sp.AAC.1